MASVRDELNAKIAALEADIASKTTDLASLKADLAQAEGTVAAWLDGEVEAAKNFISMIGKHL